MKTVKTL